MANLNSTKDKAMTDRGWSAMQKMLDENMPVARRRRPFAWWFWVLACLLVVGSLAGYTLWRQTSKSLPLHPSAPVVVQTNPGPVAPATGFSNTGNAASGSELTSKATEDRRTDIPGPGGKNAIKATNQPATLPLAALQQAGKTGIPTKQAYPDNTLIAAQETAAARQNPVETPQTVTAPGGLAPLTRPVDGPALTKLPLEPLAITAPASGTNPVPTKPVITRNPAVFHRFRPGVYGAVATSRKQSDLGLSAGALLDWQFYGRWGIRVAAGYRNLKLSNLNRPVTVVQGAAFYAITGDSAAIKISNNVNYSNNATEVLVPIAHLHQLEFPVDAWFQPAPHWKIYSGLQFNYTFGGASADQSLSLGNNQIIATNNATEKTALGQIATESLHGWKTQFDLGVGRQFGRRLELKLGYLGNFPTLSNQKEALYANFPSADAQNIADATGSRPFQLQNFRLQCCFLLRP